MAGNQDKMKLYTVEQLLRKYDFDRIAKNRKAIEVHNDGLTKIDKELSDFVKIATNSLENLQDQVDGNITTWFFVGIPTLDSYPSNEWVTDEDKIKHLGDLYYDQDTGYAYRFALQENIYTWIKITDSDVTEALALANAAQDTADKKRRVFVATPIPPYDNGDLWFNNQEIYICQIAKEKDNVYEDGDFIIATKYTDDTLAKEVDGKLTIVSGQVTIIKEGLDEISKTVEDNKYYVDEDGNKHLISQSLSEEIQRTDLISQTVQSHSSSIQGLNPVLTSSGNGQLSLPDCAGEDLLEFNVDGKSEQETSTEGTNKFDDSVIKGTVLPTSAGTIATQFSIKNKLKDNTNYYVHLFINGTDWKGNRIAFSFYDSNNNKLSEIATSTQILNLSNLSTATYMKLYINASGVSEYGGQSITGLVISESADTSYSEFISNSPSPDYPSEIKSISGIVNLFDVNIEDFKNNNITQTIISDNKFSLTGNGSYCRRWYKLHTPIKKDEIVTVSYKYINSLNDPIEFSLHSEIGVYTDETIIESGNSGTTEKNRQITVTAKTDVYYFAICVSNKNGINTTKMTITDLRIEKGTISHPYVPYGSNYLVEKATNENSEETISLIDLKDNKLCSNKEQTIKDKLIVKNGIANIDKRFKEIVLDGSENWTRMTTGNGKYRYVTDVLADLVLPIMSASGIPNLYCDHYITGSANDTYAEIECMTINVTNLVVFDTRYNTMDNTNFKNWLSNNPITVYYELATPRIIDLGEVSVKTVQSDCTLTLEEELDTDMYAKYIKNNPYNEAYSTRLDTKTQIQLSENKIESSVSETILQNTELMQGEIDSLSSNLANNYMTSEEVQNLNNLTNESLAVITNEFKQIQTSTQTQFQAITNILQNGVSLVKTTYITIDGEGLKIAKSTDSFNGVLDNKNLRFYSYENLMSVYSNKGAGFTNLLVTGQADIAYSKIMKVTQNGKKYTGIFYSDAMAQTLEDFIGE